MTYSNQHLYNDDTSAAFVGTHDAIRQLNSLLRGEISAVETYKMAIDNVDQSDQITMDRLSMLREIQSEHGQAAQLLRERIRTLGGEASDSSGAWGAWAQTVQGTANLFGDNAALKSLKEGEEHGVKDYQEAIDDVDSVSRQLIEGQLIPNQERHIALLNQLMNTTTRNA
jgi:bacterioferritin (cytochrome b1)